MTFQQDQWKPLSIEEVTLLFHHAPFRWALAGGNAVEQFLGKKIRSHSDIDVIVFREDQNTAHQWLDEWNCYAANPPGTLREWLPSELLTVGIHDIWCHRRSAEAWQLQLLFAETEGDEWFSRRNALVRGPRNEMIVEYNKVPCPRIEILLLYKAKYMREQDWVDFNACLPRLDTNAKVWLKNALHISFPEGHAWMDLLN